ncbi:murein hydrolase activator EnvC family protein [Sphingomonas sp. ID0503]|uniref:murein hydrolase activator EnvC family protein n=1 Tax=Sphingomonas sp. ID0503 TaxID=3399691 RepID=UPI003AFA883A
MRLKELAVAVAVAGHLATPALAQEDPSRTVAALVAWSRATPWLSYLHARSAADLAHLRLLRSGVEKAIALKTAQLPRAPARQPLYRLPVAGVIVTGFGEELPSGAVARGPSIMAEAGSPVVAPAGGRVRFAGNFGVYGLVVIVDHGHGWTSTVSGLTRTAVKVGMRVHGGDTIGYAGPADSLVTVELRRRGQPYDALTMAGA